MQNLNLIINITFVIISLTGNFISNENTEKLTEKSAKIEFTELKYDFGKVDEGVELSHIFKFKNTGDENLIIQSVNAGCGCTGVQIGEKKEFRKGEEGEIKVSFNTLGRTGVNTKSVTVQSNDIKNPYTELTFSCEVIQQQQK